MMKTPMMRMVVAINLVLTMRMVITMRMMMMRRMVTMSKTTTTTLVIIPMRDSRMAMSVVSSLHLFFKTPTNQPTKLHLFFKTPTNQQSNLTLSLLTSIEERKNANTRAVEENNNDSYVLAISQDFCSYNKIP